MSTGVVVEINKLTADHCGGVVEIDEALRGAWGRRESPKEIQVSTSGWRKLSKAVLGRPLRCHPSFGLIDPDDVVIAYYRNKYADCDIPIVGVPGADVQVKVIFGHGPS